MPNLPYQSIVSWASEAVEGPRRIEYPFLSAPTPDSYPRAITRRLSVGGDFSPRAGTLTSYTNYLTYSDDFSNAAWTKTNITATANQVANPWDGASTADSLLETVTNAEHRVSQAYTFTAVPTSVFFIVKGISRTRCRVLANDGSTNFSAYFDLTTGVADNASNCTTSSRSLGNSWWLVAIHFTPTAAAGNVYLNSVSSGTTVSYAGDTAKGLYCAQAQVERASSYGALVLTTTVSRTISAPDVDALANASAQGADYFAYLFAEGDVEIVNSALARFTRAYSRIPGTQYEPTSLLFVRPSLHNVNDGTNYAVSWDDGISSWLFTSRKAISAIAALTADTKAVSGTVSNSGTTPVTRKARTPNAFGSYTINFKFDGGGASSFNTTSTASSIKSTIETGGGSATVFVAKSETEIVLQANGGVFEYVECTNDDIEITGSETSISIKRVQDSADYTELSEAPSLTDTHSVTETYSVPASVRVFTTSSAHGAAVGNRVAFYNGKRIVALSVVATAPTTTTFSVPLADVDGKDFAASDVVFDSGAAYRIANGPVDVSARRVRRFYLPGVTLGVATAADIPAQTVVTRDPVSWLTTVMAYLPAPSASTYAVDSLGDVTSWMGPILEKAAIEIQMQDAVATLSVTA